MTLCSYMMFRRVEVERIGLELQDPKGWAHARSGVALTTNVGLAWSILDPWGRQSTTFHTTWPRGLVEPRGLEPLTPCLQSVGSVVAEPFSRSDLIALLHISASASGVVAAGCCCKSHARADRPVPSLRGIGMSAGRARLRADWRAGAAG